MENTFPHVNYILLVIAALIPIANPFSTAPLFISMTSDLSKADRNQIALLATTYMFIILVIFLLLGAVLLNFFGISLPALRIAGGLIVAFIGFQMLFGNEDKASAKAHHDVKSMAFTPLAMPMLSGPGSIAVIMSMAVRVSEAGSLSNQLMGYFVVIVGIAITAIICWIVLTASSRVIQFMGPSGIDALTKIMGFLLTSIGVQFVITGFKGLGVLS